MLTAILGCAAVLIPRRRIALPMLSRQNRTSPISLIMLLLKHADHDEMVRTALYET